MRVLVIEDDPDCLECMTDLLDFSGHSVVTSRTPDPILLHSAMMFDVVTCDGLNGEGRSVLAAARDLGARTVLVSGDDDAVDAELAAGFAAVRKPFFPQTLLDAVEGRTVPTVAVGVGA